MVGGRMEPAQVDDDPARGDRMPWLARAIITLYFGLTLQTRLLKQAEPGPDHLLVPTTIVIVAIFVIQYLLVIFRPRRPPAGIVPWMLAGQVALAVLPVVAFGANWFPVAGGFLAGALLLLLRPPLSWFLVAAVAASEGLFRYVQGWAPHTVLFCVFTTVNVGVSLYAITRLSGLVRELHETRAQFARSAAARERVLAAGSLTAVLGTALTRIERGGRRAIADLDRDPAAARAALDQVVAVARRALADARSVVSDLRERSPGPELPERAERPDRPGRMTQPRLSWTILVIITIGLAVEQVMFVRAESGSWTAAAAAAGVAGALVALQLRHAAAMLGGGPPRGWPWTLAAQAALVLVPYALLGREWNTMACLLAGMVLILVRPRWSWILFGLVVGAQWLPALWFPYTTLYFLYASAMAVQIGVIVYALDRLPKLARVVRAARDRLATMAALHERLRISRDVHDLLGLGLSTITVKAELARRLVAAEPGRARAELCELVALAGRSRAEVRAVAEEDEDQDLSLRAAAASARAALAAAGAEVTLVLPPEPVPAGADAVLAAVLREAATNILRHAAPGHCAIVVTLDGDAAKLYVGNDGVTRPPGSHVGGLANLAARAEAAGGRLAAGQEGAGRFALRAEIPPRAGGGPARPAATAVA